MFSEKAVLVTLMRNLGYQEIWHQAHTLPRSPAEEIDNVTICGLQEKRNETEKACRIKIVTLKD